MAIRNLTIRSRLLMIVMGVVAGILVIGVFALNELRNNLMEDRMIKTRHVVEVVHGFLTHYAAREKSGDLSPDEARKFAISAVTALRYEKSEYFWIHDLDTKMVMHPSSRSSTDRSFPGSKTLTVNTCSRK